MVAVCGLLGFLLIVARSACGKALAAEKELRAVPDSCNWPAKNKMGQSPESVAEMLLGVCQDGSRFWSVNGTMKGPDKQDANPCSCSMVTYSLLAQSLFCSDPSVAIASWGDWHAHCDDSDIRISIDQIPDSTTVPPWAYLPFKNDRFDLTAARGNATNAESPTTSSSSSTPSNPTASATPSLAGHEDTHAGLTTGAIIGITVGSAAGAALIFSLVVLLLLRRRRKARTAPSTAYLAEASERARGSHGSHPDKQKLFANSPDQTHFNDRPSVSERDSHMGYSDRPFSAGSVSEKHSDSVPMYEESRRAISESSFGTGSRVAVHKSGSIFREQIDEDEGETVMPGASLSPLHRYVDA
ncbi:hypothetical protein CYLTODRAFT_418290 [Cylindrobasidium torrendii FP15055 ss-10]|uniref:Uncharacterized protein n=1 Tax=Cylindrobasidium torrendii FP15055 ss-10 TaxID=1314674 RepID=A0A0D7BPG8_9AGAR|nr:hypothetical protein CYLTODRAFT_418290 [Cylindrobasidium torrendii FP15055 ss-10]